MNRPLLALTIALPLLLATTAIGGPFRTWTDATGKHRTEASFRGLKDGEVLLERKDGSILRVPLQKLSRADQRWLKQARNATVFDFKRVLFGPPSSLVVWVQSVDPAAGVVELAAGDARRPTTPFFFEWGDGTRTEGFFPQRHTYVDHDRNYMVSVTARYADKTHDTMEVLVPLRVSRPNASKPPSNLAVTFPSEELVLTTAVPGFTVPTLPPFDASAFGVVPRETIEHVLTAAATVQMDFVGSDVSLRNGEFRQVALSHKGFPGMYSLWFTTPVAFGVGGDSLRGAIPYSMFIHEMGHNFTLNCPARFCFGGKIDGCANAIFSESMAQIFTYATVYELVNNAEAYDLGADVVADIKRDANVTMRVVRASFDTYLKQGRRFRSWNDPGTKEDETLGSFMTVAYKFFEQAEKGIEGYGGPLKRMMALLRTFDDEMLAQYDPGHDTKEAEAYRATMMVAALSHAFGKDLRKDFRELKFPVRDPVVEQLRHRVK